MNKTAIKNFAIWARVQLMESAKQRAFEYEITENGENKAGLDSVGGRLLTATEKEQRKQLIEQIRQKGYSQVMEEAAYTWFNRFIALRFMEVNGYLPSKVRVFTDENGAFKPEILKQAMTVELEGLDRNHVLELLDKQNNEELFKYLLITQCNALNAGLPYMFEKIANWTELLFPANLLRPDSVIGTMVSSIPEENWTDQVQIIGWLYQYYNAELKDETFALLKKNVKITKERIPAATQLFTPDWIVRYMVENSLGRLWYEGHKDFDKSQWKYYLDEAEQEPEVEQQLKKIREEYAAIKPEDIKVIDPCMGSGHILVYAFDVLMQIYTSAGWSERDAAQSILENNLYGLDIDERAGQLAYFAVMMKARKYSRRILSSGVKPNVLSIQDSNWMTDEFIDYVACKDATMKADLVMLRKTFRDAKEYGSILTMPTMNYETLFERIDIIGRSYAEDLFEARYQQDTSTLLLPLVKQAQILSQKYNVVVTNPPYMGSSGMSAKLDSFVKNNYPDSKSDLFAVFIERCSAFTKAGGYQAMITQHAWMFLSSFEKLRLKLLKMDTVNMAHLGARAFEEIGGEVVQTTSFVLKNAHTPGFMGTYCRLIEPTTQQGKEDMFLFGQNRFIASQTNYLKILGTPIAYWVSNEIINMFKLKDKISKHGQALQGTITGDNEKFLRLWYEVSTINSSMFNTITTVKWFPHSKGGEFRRWYGNRDYLVNWENEGLEIRNYKDNNGKLRSRPQNIASFFKTGITWSDLTTGLFAGRFVPEGNTFDATGPTIPFSSKECIYYLLGYMNSKPFQELLNITCPGLHYNNGVISKLPIQIEQKYKDIIEVLVLDNIKQAKQDWDTFETSWEFTCHPLI